MWTGQAKRLVLQMKVLLQGGCCHYCRKPFGSDARSPTIEHLRPRMKGGTDDLVNLVAACRGCNQLRGKQMNRAKQKTESGAQA